MDPLLPPTTHMTVRISLTDPAPEHRMLLSTVSTRVSKSKRSIIVTGAGISCNAGIPVPPHINLTVLQLTANSRTFDPKMDYITS